MNRFIKKQWDDTDLPNDVRLRAREKAWDRLQPRRRFWAPALAGAAALAAIVAVFLLRTAAPPEVGENAPEPLPLAERVPPEVSTLPPAGLAETRSELPRAASATVARHRPAPAVGHPPADSDAPGEQPRRLVLNFRLPESGVRMIWVQDSNFFKEPGGSK